MELKEIILIFLNVFIAALCGFIYKLIKLHIRTEIKKIVEDLMEINNRLTK